MELSEWDERRLAIYLSGLADAAPGSYGAAPHGCVVCGASETKRSVLARYDGPPLRRSTYQRYVCQAQELVRAVDARGAFCVFPGDNRGRFPIPTLVKSRMIADRDAPGVLFPLDRTRNWDGMSAVLQGDRPFADKDDRLVWRGATTGAFKRWDGVPYSSRFHVATLDIARDDIDVGFSEVIQLTEENCDLPLDLVRARVRPAMTIGAQLGSKFLLSLEGNDVATGLRWMLSSNSTVIMPEPTCETWFCEGALVPFEHYVPVRHDLSDLEAVHDWCLSNQGDCEEISSHARAHVARFRTRSTEWSVCMAVIEGYLAKVRFELCHDPRERLVQCVRRPFDAVKALAGIGPDILGH